MDGYLCMTWLAGRLLIMAACKMLEDVVHYRGRRDNLKLRSVAMIIDLNVRGYFLRQNTNLIYIMILKNKVIFVVYFDFSCSSVN